MTYNVFRGTLNLALSICEYLHFVILSYAVVPLGGGAALCPVHLCL